MIIDDYLEYTKVYKKKYGDKCIVLMQVGSFYELYSIIDETSEDIYVIADICNIQVSKKNKTIKEVSINNPLMAGFPLYTLKKFTNILLQYNFTIVLVEQVTEPPNPERKITEVLSPGMNMNVVGKKNNYLMVVYYEYVDDLPIVGVSGVDLTTGKSFVYEVGASKTDIDVTNDEVYRLITIYNPCEIMIISDKNVDEKRRNYLTKNLNISNILTHFKWNSYEYLELMKKTTYQIAILEKSFEKQKNMISIIDSLNLERYNIGRIAFCCLLQFSYEHNSEIIKKLNVPELIENNKYLNIEYNSAIQLNILALYNNDKPLIDILDRCFTQFGSRVFKERLLKPIVDKDELSKRYDKIEFLLENNKFKEISKYLCKILDLERIKRKMLVGKLHPQDWSGFHISLENSIDVIEKFFPSIETDNFKNMITFYNQILDIDEASKYNINDIKGNIFQKGIYPEIDEDVKVYEECYETIMKIVTDINNMDTLGDSTSCKIDFSDKEGFYINITKKRFENAKNINKQYFKDFNVKNIGVSNNIKLVNHDITYCSNLIDEKKANISKNVSKFYSIFVNDFINKYCSIIEDLINIITEIDISTCNAKNAFEFRYNRPKIDEESFSYANFQNIRHPLIERLHSDFPYVGNNVELSQKHKNGILLYGINSSGKSCLMKAIGINIIMAQAGMFVACDDMIFNPYRHIFTRIAGMDNIYKGMSSFIVEMTELRNILQRCNKYSLVLGDEICSGTESTSALSIVASGIDHLVKKKSSFIFATHLHELTEIEVVKMHMNNYINVKHIHINVENNKIYYERKLKDGKGSSTYGIEVCKSLDMPIEFMNTAENVKKDIEGYGKLIIEPHKSKYNNELYLSECAICKKKAIDTHHINYQSNCDENGFFKDFHKNTKHNLVPLCKECHNKEHNGNLNIKGYKSTSSGVILDYQFEDSKNNIKYNEETSSKYEFTNEELLFIKKYVKRGKTSWYTRSGETTTFKKCDDLKVIKKIIQILNVKVKTEVLQDNKLYNFLYDPMY